MSQLEIKLMSNDSNQLKNFFAGGVGGVFTAIMGYPFDTIKVKLQAMPVPVMGEPPLYTGSWDCAMKTVQREGVLGLYKGVILPVAGVAPICAISFSAFSSGKKLINPSNDAVLTKLQLFSAGAFSGFFTTAVMAPGERIKCLLQVQHDIIKEKIYTGPIDVVRKLYREGGIQSIFRGTIATLLRDVPGNGLYFSTYELLQRQIKPDSSNESHIFGTIFAGGMAGVMYWVVGCPADVLKTRLQIAPEGKYPKGLRDVFRELLREEGITALYKGCVPILIRSFPANAICFAGFELAMYFLNQF